MMVVKATAMRWRGARGPFFLAAAMVVFVFVGGLMKLEWGKANLQMLSLFPHMYDGLDCLIF